MTGGRIPESFTARVAGRAAEPDVCGDDWLRELPGLIERCLARWALSVDGAVRHGECALVIPVTRRSERFVLKLTWPHEEARLEHLALRDWAGRGAVRLVAADPTAYVLLLERLSDTELTSVPVLEACEKIGRLFAALDKLAGPQYTTLSGTSQRWRDQSARGHPLVPRRLTDQAAGTLTRLLDGGVDGRLVHADLHDGNVLAPFDTNRGHWLAIDPKPVSGEWAYAAAPIVWNRPAEAAAAHNLRTHARRRADVVADAAGLDPDRVAQWTFVRLVLNALWSAEYAPASDPFRARMIALSKAFAD